MVDRPPPSRFSVVERGGRLVVIDRISGTTPPTAAERMAEHDRRMGVTPNLTVAPSERESPPPTRAASPAAPRPAPAQPAAHPPPTRREAAHADKRRGAAPSPWGKGAPRAAERAAQPAATDPARIPDRKPTAPGTRKTIQTSKWWDIKGPRTVELGEQGQATLTGGLMSLFFGLLFLGLILFWASPVILFAVIFALIRFGGNAIGTVGGAIVDRALKDR
ncbi:MAG: hypothetical protein U0S50_09965 [Sphingopyxis sp.]|uniref:hypothetical protein n=1 Tax=Sphingopyxis sp. TaxID=1908224 RepID=UPI002AB98373|nr:hypothetical protein [Sphingopyxis sp.]MDZ3832129.1 hypothetical protein [Sphingopyxis sp.]